MTFRLDPATAITDPSGISWGMHPITWRNDDIPEVGAFNTLEDMLLDLADVGYRGTECAGFFPPREIVKERADARGITIVAQWFSSFIVRDGIGSWPRAWAAWAASPTTTGSSWSTTTTWAPSSRPRRRRSASWR